jgi:hypothetical protein
MALEFEGTPNFLIFLSAHQLFRSFGGGIENAHFTSENLLFDDRDLRDFVLAIHRYDGICIANNQDLFTRLISWIILEDLNDTYFHIRGPILIFLFEPFFHHGTFASLLAPLLGHINNMDRDVMDCFLDCLARLPSHLMQIVRVIQDSLISYIHLVHCRSPESLSLFSSGLL